MTEQRAAEPFPYRLPADGAACYVCDWPRTQRDYVVAENEDAISLIAPRQRAEVSVVVAPRQHVVTPSQLSGPAMAALWQLVQDVTVAVEAAAHPDGMHTWHDIGTEADASFAHLTVDIVPRWRDVPYRFAPYRHLQAAPDEARLAQARRLAAALRQTR